MSVLRLELGVWMMTDINRKLVSLHGLLQPERLEDPPDMLFAIVLDPEAPEPDPLKGSPVSVSLTIESFVKLSALPPELSNSIREYLRSREVPPRRLHKDTLAEVEESKKSGDPALRTSLKEVLEKLKQGDQS